MDLSLVLAIAAVLAIIYVVPLVIYGGASARGWLDVPAQASPQAFLLGILVTKLGTAAAFVLVLELSGEAWTGRWLSYGSIWFVMFAMSEIGDAITRRSSWPEALLGIAAEAIYAPAAALVTFWILGIGRS